jgi:hypothetical protein
MFAGLLDVCVTVGVPFVMTEGVVVPCAVALAAGVVVAEAVPVAAGVAVDVAVAVGVPEDGPFAGLLVSGNLFKRALISAVLGIVEKPVIVTTVIFCDAVIGRSSKLTLIDGYFCLSVF